MKKTFFGLCWLLFFVGKTVAQDVVATINVLPPYPVELDHYLDNSENVVVTLTNTTSSDLSLYTQMYVQSVDGSIRIGVSESYKPSSGFSLLANETKMLSGDDLEELELDFSYPSDVEYEGLTTEEYADILFYRALPEGIYQLCFNILNFETDELVSEECSAEFEIAKLQAPVIITPENLQEVTEEEGSLLLSWLPTTTGLAAVNINYEVQILEVLEEEAEDLDYVNTLFDAGQGTIIFEDETMSTSSSFLLSDYGQFDNSKVYAIRVTANDELGTYEIENDGKSNIVFFRMDATSCISVDYPSDEATINLTENLIIQFSDSADKDLTEGNFDVLLSSIEAGMLSYPNISAATLEIPVSDLVAGAEYQIIVSDNCENPISFSVEEDCIEITSPSNNETISLEEDLEIIFEHNNGKDFAANPFDILISNDSAGMNNIVNHSDTLLEIPIEDLLEGETYMVAVSDMCDEPIQFKVPTDCIKVTGIEQGDSLSLAKDLTLRFSKTGGFDFPDDDFSLLLTNLSTGMEVYEVDTTILKIEKEDFEKGANYVLGFDNMCDESISFFIPDNCKKITYPNNGDTLALDENLVLKFEDFHKEDLTQDTFNVLLSSTTAGMTNFENISASSLEIDLEDLEVGTTYTVTIDEMCGDPITFTLKEAAALCLEVETNIENDTLFNNEPLNLTFTHSRGTDISKDSFMIYLAGNSYLDSVGVRGSVYGFEMDTLALGAYSLTYALGDGSLEACGTLEFILADSTFATQDSISKCEEDCYFTETIITYTATDQTAFSTLQIGHFEIEDLEELKESGGTLSGKGVIEIDFLMGVKVQVEFDGVKVNTDGRIFDGKVMAAEEDTPFDLSEINSKLESMTSKIPDSAAEMIGEYLDEGRLVSALVNDRDIGLPIAIDRSIKGYSFYFGFTKMTFEPETASVNLLASLHLPSFGEDNNIALGASEICVNPGGFSSEFILHLAEDLTINKDELEVFTIKGGGSDEEEIKEEATYFQMNCEGIQAFALRGSIELPVSTFLPEDEDGEILEDEKVTAKFAFELEKGGDSDSLETETKGLHWMANLDFDPFQIKGLEGWGFEIDEAWLDMSDLGNPADLKFPDNYDLATEDDDTWQGLYLKSGYLKTPKEFMGGENRKSVEIANLLIDPTVTMDLQLTNLVDTDEGNLDGWGFSLDTVRLSMLQNAFESGDILGKISMPVMDTAEFLTYSAMLSMGDTTGLTYQFLIDPSAEITIPMWIAQAELNESSYIKAEIGKDSTYIESFLKGIVSVDIEKFAPESVASEVPATFRMPGASFEFKLHSQDGFSDASFGFSSGVSNSSTSFNYKQTEELWASVDEFPYHFSGSEEETSAQNTLSGFPISLEDYDLEMSGNNIGLSFTPALSLEGGEAGFSVSTTLKLEAELDISTKGIEHFKFTKLKVECVELEVDVANILMEGAMCFYNDRDEDGEGDKGVKGNLNVKVPGIDIGVNLAAEFGTRVTDVDADFGTEDNFSYWFVDGLFYTGAGLAVSPYFTIHGMGGGITVNMKQVDETATVSAENLEGAEKSDPSKITEDPDEAEVTATGIEREPYFGARGLSFTLIMAIVKAELLNADAGMEVTWIEGEGIQTVTFNSDGYFFTPLNDRKDAQLRADKSLTWSFLGDGDIAVDGELDVYMNLEVVKGALGDNKMVDGASAHWQNYGGDNGNGYFDLILGDYDNRGSAKIDFGADWVKFDANIYFMAGNNVPTSLPPLPDKIEEILNYGTTSDGDNSFSGTAVSEDEEERSEEELEDYRTGGGIAHGSEINAHIDVDIEILYGEFEATFGKDLNITHDEERVCYADNNYSVAPGINGWYGMGQVYAGISGDLGVRVKVFKEEFKIKLMDLGAAIAIEGGFPNPIWAEGRGAVYYNVLNGTLEGSSQFAIAFGDKCEPEQKDALAEINFIGDIYPEDGDRSINPYTDPAVSFHLPMDEILEVPILDENGNEEIHKFKPYLHEFTVEHQGNGELTGATEKWNAYNTQLNLRYDDPFPPRETGSPAPKIDMSVTVRAKKWDEDENDWVDFYGDNNELWEENKTATFRVGFHPDNFDDDYVKYSIPLNRQRFFLQDEVENSLSRTTTTGSGLSTPGASSSKGKSSTTVSTVKKGVIKFKQNMDGFFPESDTDGDYGYLIRFRATGQDDLDVEMPSLAGSSSIDEVEFTLPTLENETLYAVQIVQKNTNQMMVNAETLMENFNIYDVSNADNDTYSYYELVSRAASAESLAETVNRGETLLYVFYFQTSAYDNLEDKLASADLNQMIANLVYLETDEQFDEYDVLGATDGDGDEIASRVSIFDPFENSYHNNKVAPTVLDGYLDYEDHFSSNPIIYSSRRYQTLSDLQIPIHELSLTWETDMTNNLNEHITGGYKNALSNAEVKSEFSALFQTFNGTSGLTMPSGSSWGTSSTSSSGTSLIFGFTTHAETESDAEELTDWATGILDDYFYNAGKGWGYHYEDYFEDNYEDFIDWHTTLLNRGTDLSDFNSVATASSSAVSTKGTWGKSAASGTKYKIRFTAETATDLDDTEEGTSETLEVEMN